MMLHFSTATVEDRWQLGYWRDVVCDTFVRYGFEAPQRGGAGFRGEVTAQSLGGVQVATVISEPHVVFRSPAEIRASSEDDYLVNLAVRGRVRVSQDGRDADLRSGDLAVYDSARPCRIACPGQFELVALKVPRQLFHAHSRLPRDVTATPLRGDQGVGALLSPLLRSAAALAPELPPDVVSRVVTTMLELLCTALSERIGADSRPSLPQEAQLFRARRFITDHLADPDLSPTTVADALGMSVRYLHMLFRSAGTSPFRWIQEQRLDTAARLLADPSHAGRSVTDIAFTIGFTDGAHFSRTFRSRFGAPPRDYRREHSCRRTAD
jgi:AraC-like DNA-binding protein